MAAVRPLVLAAILVLSLASLPVHAGTEADPEVVDPADDAAQAPQAGQDIVKVWIDDALTATAADGAPALFLHLETAADFEQAPSFFALSERYHVTFVPSSGVPAGGVEAYINLSPTRGDGPQGAPGAGDEAAGCKFGTAAKAGGSAAIADEVAGEGVQESDHQFGCRLPLALLPGFAAGSSVTGLVATLQLVQRGPLNGAPPEGGDQAGVNVLQTFDTAPDTGAGRAYALVGGPNLLRATLNGTRVDLHHSFNATQSRTYVYNWTQGPANATVRLDVHGEGNATVQVRDAANATLFQRTLHEGSATVNVTGQAGRWTLTLNYTAFQGNLTLAIEPRAAPPVTTVSPSGTGTADTTRPSSGSTSSSSSTKGSPTVGLALLLAGLGVALAARRRRIP
jgi:MYXO-CTERM domain-containing protein